MSKPRLLDLFCCQGGAAKGYADAGFEVVGVDINPQPRYPYEFHQGDAIDYLLAHGDEFDAIHASPPCQAWTRAQKIMKRQHPELIHPVRELLLETEKPYVIENVEGAPLLDPVMLCGLSFGYRTFRHRLFETSFHVPATEHPDHPGRTVKMGRRLSEGDYYHAVGNFSNVAYVKRDLSVEWMTRDGIRECIPPAYTAWVGRRLMATL